MITNRIIAILALIIFVGACVGSFFLGRATTARDAEVKRDTVYKYDTIIRWKPQPTSSKITGTQKAKAIAVKPKQEPPVIERKDSVEERKDSLAIKSPMAESKDSVEVELPIIERTYLDEQYKITIEGYNPVLKSIEVYPRTAYITTTETITKRKRWGVSLGVQGGYGITPQGMQPYAGVGISFGYSF
jgi:hypothetical protein